MATAATTGAAAQTAGAYPATAPQQMAANTPAANPAATTGSITGAYNAVVPSVVGAPGDGSQSLTGAIQRELSKNGVALTSAPSTSTYKVEGKVAMGAGKDGKQPIQIDWSVYDPQARSSARFRRRTRFRRARSTAPGVRRRMPPLKPPPRAS